MRGTLLSGALALGLFSLAFGEARPRSDPQATAERGEDLFFHETYGGNGRVCATCHDPRNEFTISPALARDRWRREPGGPLFRASDSDDGSGNGYTRLLTRAQFRVRVALADSVFVVDAPAERSILVWRGVPSLQNLQLTAPYAADGRFDTLQLQAAGAIADHLQPTRAPRDRELDSLALFELQAFYPLRLRALLPTSGDTLPLEPEFSIPVASPASIRGKGVFDTHCARCHSGELRNRPLEHHQPLFGSVQVSERNVTGLPVLHLGFRRPDGSVLLVDTPDPGRGAITGNTDEINAFEIPSLRGIRHTAPYFHDSSALTLQEVVTHYDTVLELGLTVEEAEDLLSYLEVL